MSEQEYCYDERPGRRYWLRALDAALKFQGVWGMYWAIQRMRRRKGAMGFQKLIRGFLAFRQFHPLIIFRMKYGKRTYYEFCLSRWKSYNRILKMCKEAIAHALDKTQFYECWGAWKIFVSVAKEEKEKLIRRVLYKLINAGLVRTFDALRKNAVRCRYIKIKMRRMIGFPHFDMWCDFVDAAKHTRKINNAATSISKIVRRKISFKRFKAKKKIGIVLGIIIRAQVKCILIRKALLAKNFLLWEIQETENLAVLQNEEERKRLLKEHNAVVEREKFWNLDLKKHLRSRYGKIQIQVASQSLLQSKRIELAAIEEEKMYLQCSSYHRACAKYDYHVKTPPFLTCVDPKCPGTFISYGQYHNHWRNDPQHVAFLQSQHLDPSAEINQIDEEEKAREIEKVLHLTPAKHAYPKPILDIDLDLDLDPEKDPAKDSVNLKPKACIDIPDYHILLLCPEVRATHHASFSRLMMVPKPGILTRQDRITPLTRHMYEPDEPEEQQKQKSRFNFLGGGGGAGGGMPEGQKGQKKRFTIMGSLLGQNAKVEPQDPPKSNKSTEKGQEGGGGGGGRDRFTPFCRYSLSHCRGTEGKGIRGRSKGRKSTKG